MMGFPTRDEEKVDLTVTKLTVGLNVRRNRSGPTYTEHR